MQSIIGPHYGRIGPFKPITILIMNQMIKKKHQFHLVLKKKYPIVPYQFVNGWFRYVHQVQMINCIGIVKKPSGFENYVGIKSHLYSNYMVLSVIIQSMKNITLHWILNNFYPFNPCSNGQIENV